MSTIKNFIYLDYEKMYSLSAQLFKGVVFESIAEKGYIFSEGNTHNESKKTASEHTNTENTSRKNYIKPYDYHYAMFEEKLDELQKVIIIDKDNHDIFNPLNEIKNHPFIKSKGEIIITDPRELYEITLNHKKIAGHLKYITNSERLHAIYEELAALESNQKAQISLLRAEARKIEETIKHETECINDSYHKHLAEIIKFSFGEDDIQVTQNLKERIITAYMNRNFFKQSLQSIVKKYSRKTTSQFTMLGMVTQYKANDWMLPEIASPDFREAVKNIVLAQHELEQTFSQPGDGETVIEAIAMYTEL
ncbi:hypothetical protein I5N29_03600 [Serratia marcescens]|nr:hypothetical protein [Serratia marcescens]